MSVFPEGTTSASGLSKNLSGFFRKRTERSEEEKKKLKKEEEQKGFFSSVSAFIRKKAQEASKPKPRTISSLPSAGELLENLKNAPRFGTPEHDALVEEKKQKAKESAKPVKEAIVGFLRDTTRIGAGAGVELIENITKQEGLEFIPESKFEKFLFGDRPVAGLDEQGEEFLKDMGASEEFAAEYGMTTGVLLLGIELIPGGKGGKLPKLLSKTDDVADVTRVLRGVKELDVSVIDDIAPQIAKTSNRAKINRILTKATKDSKKALKTASGADDAADLVKGTDDAADITKTTDDVASVPKAGDDIAQTGKVAKVADNINLERLNIDDAAKKNIDQTIDEIKPDLEEIRGKKLSNEEVIEAASRSDVLTRVTKKEQFKNLEAQLLKTRQHVAELAKGNDVSEEFIQGLKIISTEATNRGRALQNLKIGADPVLNTVKVKMVDELVKLGVDTDAIIKASKGVDFSDASQSAAFYRKFVQPTWNELLDEYRYINMLSSPKTHIINTFSNLLQTVFTAPGTRLFSGITDSILAKLTGRARQKYISEVPAYFKGALNSVRGAATDAMDVFRGKRIIERPDIGFRASDLKRLPSDPSQLKGGKKRLAWFNKRFRVVPQALEFGDVFFRTIIRNGEAEALAVRAAKSGKKVNRAKVFQEASARAEMYVFRKALDPSNKTGQGAVLSGIDKVTSGVYKLRDVPGVKWFVPFVQTPMNILKQGIEYSPLGFTTIIKSADKVEQFSKALMGTTVFAAAGAMAMEERTTWAAPTNEKQREAFYAAGMQPYSVKIGDKWVAYSKLGPWAYPLAMAAGG